MELMMALNVRFSGGKAQVFKFLGQLVMKAEVFFIFYFIISPNRNPSFVQSALYQR